MGPDDPPVRGRVPDPDGLEDDFVMTVASTDVEGLDDELGLDDLVGETLALDDEVADTLVDVDGDTEVVTLGLGDVQSSVSTVSLNGGTPPEVIDPVTVWPVSVNVVVSTAGASWYDGLVRTWCATNVPSTVRSMTVPAG